MIKVLVYVSLPPHLRGHPDVAQVGRWAPQPEARSLPEYVVEHLPASVRVKVDLVIAEDDEQALREIEDTDVFFGWLTPELLQRARKLRWAQCTNGSQEQHMFPALAASDVVLTSVSGIYNDIIADHVYALILGLTRQIHRFVCSQARHFWDDKRYYQVPTGFKTEFLAGKTLGVIGLGGIGGEVAKRGPCFGMRVVAVRAHPEAPKPDYVDRVWGQDGLDNLLRESDLVVNAAPETPRTRRMIGGRELALMKSTAYVFNVGRGSAIDLDALTKALSDGRIAGAGLDVFETEPLPADHPLWELDNVIITPHMAGVPTPPTRRADVFISNLSRYVEDRPLANVVKKSEWR